MKPKLSNLADGAVQERFEIEMQKILENIVDPNTDARKKRKLQLTLTLEPNDDRSLGDLQIETKTILAPPMAVTTALMIGFDSDGAVASREIMQTRLFDDEEVAAAQEEHGSRKVSYIERKQGGQA